MNSKRNNSDNANKLKQWNFLLGFFLDNDWQLNQVLEGNQLRFCSYSDLRTVIAGLWYGTLNWTSQLKEMILFQSFLQDFRLRIKSTKDVLGMPSDLER